MRQFHIFFVLLLSLLNMQIITCSITNSVKHRISDKEIVLEIPLETDDMLYSDYLTFMIDNPAINLGQWHGSEPAPFFDPAFNEYKNALSGDVCISVPIEVQDDAPLENTHLCISYYLKSKGMIQETIALGQEKRVQAEIQTAVDIPSPQEIQTQKTESAARTSSSKSDVCKPSSSFLNIISNTMKQSDSLLLRLIMVFLLGLLMSLTPCIYPMIPITAGILQAQQSKSLFTSFCLALSYTIGIATTFAILGLLAAFAGQAMGQLMNHPAFIIPLVVLLIYLALSMIGVYEMYIPRFLQPREHKVSGGSFISAFAFGAISGIVASPSLSPGLVSLLLIVTTLCSKLLGFLLLFTFGIGLGIPLLIIGTFSSSLTLLPRAGMWMVEIKKLFGYLMLAMCLYFLNNILPWSVMSWIIVLFSVSVGLIFLITAKRAHSKIWQRVYTGLGIVLIAASVVFGFKACQTLSPDQCSATHAGWENSYACGLEKAKRESKPLLVDIGAPFCSICKAIDATLFADVAVQEFLLAHTVPVKIDGSCNENSDLLQRYRVFGCPTILLINPVTQAVIKQWGPELYGRDPREFIAAIEELIAKK